MLEPTWAMARPGSGQSFVICAGPAQERFSFIGKMKAFVLLARPEFLLSSATGYMHNKEKLNMQIHHDTISANIHCVEKLIN
jgi:hypothetical protein